MKVSLNTLRRSWLGLASMGMVAAPLAISPAAAQEAQIEVQVVAGEEETKKRESREIEQLQAEMRRLREELSRRERDLAGALSTFATSAEPRYSVSTRCGCSRRLSSIERCTPCCKRAETGKFGLASTRGR
ncbi:MAG: hypothetical protein R3B96_20330 [Pirellulaceae bacterium]